MKQQNREPDPWQCQICGELFVVPSLARCCEMKHNGVVFVRQPYVPKHNQIPLKKEKED
jgi:hypothetical protein